MSDGRFISKSSPYLIGPRILARLLLLVLLIVLGNANAETFQNIVNITSQTTVRTSRSYFDRANQELRFTVTVTNKGTYPLRSPIVVTVSGLPSTVIFYSSDNLTDGTPCLNVSNYIPGGNLLQPGKTTTACQMGFRVIGALPRLTPRFSVWGHPQLAVTASASPTTGPIPLAVSFSANVTGGPVSLYEWDFTSDGTFDWSSSVSSNANYTYSSLGTFIATVRVTNSIGLTATATVVVSTQSALEAIPGATPIRGPAPLTVHFTTAGQDPGGTIVIFRWDFDGNGTWDTYDTVARDYNYTYNTRGTYHPVLFVQSSTGVTDTTSLTITVESNPPKASADMVPSNGQVPLTVQCLGSGTDSDGRIVLYEWDFDGDGVYDWSSTSSGNVSHTYTTIGTYNSVFRVTDNDGQTATATAATTVVRAGPPGSPSVTASANPTSGAAPLVVQLTGTATDPDNNIVRYEWDFESDGTYDWSSATNASTNHTYTKAGTHAATLRVTDATGLTGIDSVFIFVNLSTSLSISNNTVGFLSTNTSGMTAIASSQYDSSYPPSNAIDGNLDSLWWCGSGDTPPYGHNTFFEVTFSQLQKLSGLTIRFYDGYYRIYRGRIEIYNNTGTSVYSSEVVFPGDVSSFNMPGIENVLKIRIVALEVGYPDYFGIREFQVQSTPMPTDPDPSEPEPTGTNINTSISADTRVSVYIKDSQGNRIRTLVDNQPRLMGSYSDYWNCRTDGGLVANDGLYYAILAYQLEGVWQELDLTRTTGGTRSEFPFGSGCDTRDYFTDGYTFSPFNDEMMAMTFRLCTAQEVMAFIGPLWSGNDQDRTRTIVNRQAFPAGTNVIYWDGLNDQGEIAQAPSGDVLITGFWRYSLPDNAMYLTGGRPEVSNVSADTNYFSPFSEKCDPPCNGAGVLVSYTLSENVQYVELRVYSVTTSTLLRTLRVGGNVEAGQQTLFWDGKNNNNEYVDIGDYRVGLIAVDAQGNESLLRYTLVRTDY